MSEFIKNISEYSQNIFIEPIQPKNISLKTLSWTQMKCKLAKSGSLVLKRGIVVDKYCFSMTGITIPILWERPIKSLGKLFHCSLRDTTAIQRTTKDLKSWLIKTKKSNFDLHAHTKRSIKRMFFFSPGCRYYFNYFHSSAMLIVSKSNY